MAHRTRLPEPAASPRSPAAEPVRSIESLRHALLTRDEWLRLAAQGSQLGLWYWDEVTRTVSCDRKTREIFGIDLEGDITLDTFWEAIHPDDLERVQTVWRYELLSGLPYELEYRSLWPDGKVRWIHARGSGFYDEAGKPLYMIGVVLDVTERKESERERLELGGRLIHAQEREGRRLAREIHDDFCQRFAVLTLKLQAIAQSVPDSDAQPLLQELLCAFSELGGDLQRFSHQLHSSKLEVLGLVPSLASLCAEVAKDSGLRVELVHDPLPTPVDNDTALCLFRIAQEGLRNAVRHSGASRVDVRLTASPGSIALTVFDDGRGFDPSARRDSDGIGVQSMRERARMCGGDLEIRSRPSVHGTRVEAKLPLPPAALET